MKKRTNFSGAVGAWITSELHPAGATYESPNSNFSSVKLNGIYGTLDYLSIGWFGVDMTNPNSPTLQTSNEFLARQVTDARAQNPDLIIFGLLSYSQELTNNLKTIIKSPTVLATFASNIASYLGSHNMNGFDIDWENPTTNLTQAECGLWLNALGLAFGDTYYLAVSPSSTTNLNAEAVNANVDLVNLQSYWVYEPSQFISYGIRPDLLGFGAYFESHVTAMAAAQNYNTGISYEGNTYPYQSMISWRLDSSDWSFEQSQQLLLRPYMFGEPFLIPFDDGVILDAQTTATKMTNVVIRSGEVVDAIQTTNNTSDGSYELQLLQHGGDGGIANPPITLDANTGLDSFQYVTGNWYGQQVIAQITINGICYPASIHSSVSNPQTQNVSAPTGKTIVAFSGQSMHVNLAGGGITWVLSEIKAVFG